MKPEISVVIPSLGHFASLSRLLDSISKQSLQGEAVQILVVVNGMLSKEHKSQLQNLKGAQILFMANRGVNLARNYGIKNVTSDIAVFFDDDCSLQDKNFLQKHIDFHRGRSEVFAYGGGYMLPENTGFWDVAYNYLQMKWLHSGIFENSFTRILLGGNFSVKMSIVKNKNLYFDEAILYGGSEYEFFRQAFLKNMPMMMNNHDVIHHTNESLGSVTRKLYKQGAGKAHIDVKFGEIEELKKSHYQESLPFLRKLALLYFNYVFWLGYYSQKGKKALIFKHILKDIISNLNLLRYAVLNRLSEQISSKKDKGDRF